MVDAQKDFREFGFACTKSGRDIIPVRDMVQERLLPCAGRGSVIHKDHIIIFKYIAEEDSCLRFLRT